MKRTHDEPSDPFEAAWAAFVEHDRRAAPGAEVERRTVAAARAVLARRRGTRRGVRWTWVSAAMAAAALAAVILIPRVLRGPNADNPREEPHGVAVSLATLAADPILDTESLQLVRVRLPRAALGAFGVAPAGPDGGDVVDVDVLVGDDGLAREIREIQPVLDTGTPN